MDVRAGRAENGRQRRKRRVRPGLPFSAMRLWRRLASVTTNSRYISAISGSSRLRRQCDTDARSGHVHAGNPGRREAARALSTPTCDVYLNRSASSETMAASTLSIDWRSEAILATTSATSGGCSARCARRWFRIRFLLLAGSQSCCSLSLMGISLPRTLPRHLPNSGHFAK